VPDVLVVSETEILENETGDVEIIAVAEQGPPGASWPQPFLVSQRFGEIAADPVAQAQARINLDLQNIDGGTFN
jgi:hypothetical protein